MGANLLAYGKKVVGLEGEPRKWTLLGTTTGTTEIEIPENVEEVMVETNYSTVYYNSVFLPIQDTATFRAGYYGQSNSYGYSIISWNKSTKKASINSFNLNGTDRTASATAKWYVR